MANKWACILAVLGAILLCAVAAHAQESYHAVIWTAGGGLWDLGTLGGNESRALGVNDAGQVVGFARDVAGVRHAFVWDSTNGMQDLGTLGGLHSVARAINNNGQVVGYSVNGEGLQRGFIWDATNGMQDLQTLLGDSGTSSAADINNLGQVVGSSSAEGDSYPHAFLWDATNGMSDLGVLNGPYGTFANAINDAGQVVGRASVVSGPFNQRTEQAFIWDATNGMAELGVSTLYSSAEDINELGQVIGHRLGGSGGFNSTGFLWTEGGGVQEFVDPQTYEVASQAYGTNEWEDTVGTNFVWDPIEGIVVPANLMGNECYLQEINESGMAVGFALLPDAVLGDYNGDHHVDTADYTLWADSFGQDDRIVFAAGTSNGDGLVDTADYTAWADNYNAGYYVMSQSIPEPATLTLLALGGILALRRRK